MFPKTIQILNKNDFDLYSGIKNLPLDSLTGRLRAQNLIDNVVEIADLFRFFAGKQEITEKLVSILIASANNEKFKTATSLKMLFKVLLINFKERTDDRKIKYILNNVETALLNNLNPLQTIPS